MKKEKINIFFACDDNYIPFLATTIQSLKRHCDKQRDYKIIILNSGIKKENVDKIKNAYNSKNFNISFFDMTCYLEEINNRLHTRDYYSKTTYYRLFIPSIFTDINKALYLDSDIILKGDVSQLYDISLGNNLVGAVHDSFVDLFSELKLYIENKVGVKPYTKYFNAGVLLMNLKELRTFNFKDKFIELLSRVKFDIAQDQDYLNALCKGRVKLIDVSWNFMPLENTTKSESIKLIHFNLDYKPWQKDGILYSDLFWEFASQTEFYQDIIAVKRKFDLARIENAKNQTENFIKNAYNQAMDKQENQRIANIIKKIKEKKEWKPVQNQLTDLKCWIKSKNLNEWEYSIEMLKMTP